jgi:hypothetical protein
MNTFKLCFISYLVLTSFITDVQADTAQELRHCQSIANNSDRLACFDAITVDAIKVKEVTVAVLNNKQNENHDHAINTIKTNNTFPTLIADLNEPNLFISLGNLDFLGNSFRSVLLGGGKRQSVKDFEFDNGHSLAFNVFGQIRSQFDVKQLDTRNNRGGALINTDFSVGGEIVQSLDGWNWRFSYTHKSTHLGDEFLIDNPEYLDKRINLSYETVRWDAHKNFNNWDVYAGLGFITRSEPGNLEKLMWQTGWQFQGARWHNIKPIWAVDLTSWGAYDWNINMNMRAGIEIHRLTNSPFQLLFEYQDGHSPYGQFFTEDLTFTGLTFLKNW